MNVIKFKIDTIPTVLYGESSDRVWLFVHGKCGCKEEGEVFAEVVCPKGWQVLAIDLPEHGERQSGKPGFDPWHVVPELRSMLTYAQQCWAHIALRATSIGAWFSMQAFAGAPLEKAQFVSPVLDISGQKQMKSDWSRRVKSTPIWEKPCPGATFNMQRSIPLPPGIQTPPSSMWTRTT